MPKVKTEATVTRAERWTCIGKRLNSKGRLVQYWQTPGETGMVAVGNVFVPGAGVGAIYEVSYSPDDKLWAKGQHAPKFVDRLATDHPDVVEWTALDRAAHVEHERVRAAKNANKDGAFDEALAQLRRGYNDCRTVNEAAGFLAWVTAQVTRYEPKG